jgi:hypothetical protein
MGRKLQTLLPIAPKQLKPKLPIFRSLRENEKESKLKQKRNYDRRHRLMNETADVVYKFNLSGGFEILPDFVT